MNLVCLLAAFLCFSLGTYITWDSGTAARCLYGGLDFMVIGLILAGLPASWPWRKS